MRDLRQNVRVHPAEWKLAMEEPDSKVDVAACMVTAATESPDGKAEVTGMKFVTMVGNVIPQDRGLRPWAATVGPNGKVERGACNDTGSHSGC